MGTALRQRLANQDRQRQLDVWYIHMTDQVHDAALDELDEVLVDVHQALQRPQYRRQWMARLGDAATLGTLRVVRAVERASDAPSVGDIAEWLVIDPSTASRSVDDAVERGYLSRQACANDRRRTRLFLTEQGTMLLSRMTDGRRDLLSEVTIDWVEDEVSDLVVRLRRLVAGFDRLEDRR